VRIRPGWPGSLATSRPVATSQIRRLRFQEAPARWAPSGENATTPKPGESAPKDDFGAPVAASQVRTGPTPAVARVAPSGAKATELTPPTSAAPGADRNESRSRPSAASQTRTSPSAEPEAIARPSRPKARALGSPTKAGRTALDRRSAGPNSRSDVPVAARAGATSARVPPAPSGPGPGPTARDSIAPSRPQAARIRPSADQPRTKRGPSPPRSSAHRRPEAESRSVTIEAQSDAARVEPSGDQARAVTGPRREPKAARQEFPPPATSPSGTAELTPMSVASATPRATVAASDRVQDHAEAGAGTGAGVVGPPRRMSSGQPIIGRSSSSGRVAGVEIRNISCLPGRQLRTILSRLPSLLPP